MAVRAASKLAKYRSMRNFDVTSEPSGKDARGEKAAAADGLPGAPGLAYETRVRSPESLTPTLALYR